MSIAAAALTDLRPISERTRQNYIKTFKTVRNASVGKRTTDEKEPALVTLTQIVEDYFSREDQANTTRAMVRAAMLWIIRSGEVDFTVDAQDSLNLLEALKGKDGPKVKIHRLKTIPSKDLDLLLDLLYGQAESRKKTRASIRTVAWIRAGLACGARPVEWLNTGWVDEAQTQLRIKNAKVKISAPAFLRNKAEEPSAPVTQISYQQEQEKLKHWEADMDYEPPTEKSHRIVPIDNNFDREAINMHLGFIQEIIPPHLNSLDREKAFEGYFKNARQTLDRACRKIWGKKKLYTLYTMRGQFSANMKAAKGPVVTAALMGHSSETTPSASHYGKANQAHTRFKTDRPSAMPQRKILDPYKDRGRRPVE